MNQYEHIDELIAKHLAEETSAAEQDIINSWVSNSESNSMYYSEMKTVYEAAKSKIMQDQIDTDAAWNEFSRKLHSSNDEKSIIKKLVSTFYGKAAIFICVLGLGYLIYNQMKSKEKLIVFSCPAHTTRNHTLSDGTFITLHSGSSVAYSSSFNTTNRDLKLSGEAFFRVQHNADLPFIINTGNVFVKDIGTSFIVKALPSDSIVKVNVTEGEVFFYSSPDTGMRLLKNETGIYSLISGTFRKEETSNTSEPEADRTLNFENTSLQLVIDTLNKVYNEHIVLSCKKLQLLELTAAFKEKTAAPIIEIIAETFDLSVIRENGTVTLNSRSCKE